MYQKYFWIPHGWYMQQSVVILIKTIGIGIVCSCCDVYSRNWFLESFAEYFWVTLGWYMQQSVVISIKTIGKINCTPWWANFLKNVCSYCDVFSINWFDWFLTPQLTSKGKVMSKLVVCSRKTSWETSFSRVGCER